MAGFRVIIVGAGIGGLTLANCLQHAGIDFLLLEGREEIGLHVGAGVGIEPNGDRILDQLGVRSDLEDDLVPNRCYLFRDIRGKLMYERDGPTLLAQRTGYFPWVYDRSKVLIALYNRIREKERVLVRKRVQRITYENRLPVVYCADKSNYTGDIVVGSDGVNSAVRGEMWRLASPGTIPPSDKQYLTSEYKGLYGISDPIDGLDPGTMTMVVGVNELCYWMVGKHGRCYWCLVQKLPHKLGFPNVPKYTDTEAVAYAEENSGKVLLSDTAHVTFGDLWRKRKAYALVNVEEGNMHSWTTGRIVCIGDIVHKVTPESGQGANQAIETAASLANHLKRMLDGCTKASPSSDEVERCLADFQAHRAPVAREVVRLTNRNVRVLSLSTPVIKFIIEHMTPILGDLSTNQMCDRYIGSDRVDFLPIPPRSTQGTMPFNPTQGVARNESRARRAVVGLPLIVIAVVSLFVEDKSVPVFRIIEAPIYLILVLEGCRRANSMKPIQWTLLFSLLSQTYGITLCANIWFYLHYLLSPIEVYGPSDQRLLQMNYVRTALPSIAMTCLLPILFILSGWNPSLADDLLSLWSWVPVLLTACHRLLALFVKDTTGYDRLYNVKADIHFIRRAVVATGLVSLVSFLHLNYGFGKALFPLRYLMMSATVGQQSLCLHLGGMFWLSLLCSDIKLARMVRYRWVTLFAAMVAGVVFLGPGTTVLAAWTWREEVLATRRHGDVTTR